MASLQLEARGLVFATTEESYEKDARQLGLYWEDVLDAAQAQGRTINQTFLEELKQSSGTKSSGTTTNVAAIDLSQHTPTTGSGEQKNDATLGQTDKECLSTGEEKVDVMTPQEVDDKLKGLVYRYKNVLPPPLLEELHDYLVSNKDLRKVFLAASMLGRYNLRDNVPKFVLKIFKDANTKVELKTGTDGEQPMYDWGQTSETYTYTMNINDHPVARKVLDYINATTNAHHNNMYIIYYFDGDHYINAHQDKDHTFVEGASFFLLNLLLKGDPRTFQFVATNKNGGKVIEAYAMVDNEGFEVTCIGNRTVKHGLKIEKSWVGFRCSLVLRTINDLYLARPAESKPVTYAGDATPQYTQMNNIAMEVSKDGGKTFTHAADLIPIRDKRAQMFLDIKRFQKAGNVVALRALLDTPHGRVQAKLEKGYKGAYYMFVCQCQGASNEEEIDALCAAYPKAYQKKTRKEKTWPAYIEQRKTEWRSKQLQ